ncbi:MAG: pyrroline-5-carboxylate reductase [Armatimonadota bacterium]|nr:pyrroline-5-carboxylate reductase [bacterium]
MTADKIGRLAVIGAGAMGSAFAKGVTAGGLFAPGEVTMVDVDVSRLECIAHELGVNTSSDSANAIKDADVILLAVKPGIVRDALGDIEAAVKPSQLIVSIAAGVKLEVLESSLPKGSAVVRAMPNTPCQISAGAVGFSRGRSVTDDQAAVAKRLFDAVGLSYEVPEKLLDAVTGLSGSGPAYVYVMIEALSDAGVRVGLPRDISTALSAQTVMGAARMVIEEGEHPAKLKDRVTSPGGTTIAGIDALERNGFRSSLIEAVKAATRRSEELG